MRTINARFESDCPQCHKHINIGDAVSNPKVKNKSGGNAFANMWYCKECATDFEELGPQYGSYLDQASKEADELRMKPIHDRMKARQVK